MLAMEAKAIRKDFLWMIHKDYKDTVRLAVTIRQEIDYRGQHGQFGGTNASPDLGRDGNATPNDVLLSTPNVHYPAGTPPA